MPSYYRDPAAPAPNQPRRIGVVAVIERDGAILMERRADFGTWGLVGGLLEEDEDVGSAIAREIHEETGLNALSIELFGVFSDPSRIVAYPDGNVIRLLSVVFRVAVEDGEPRASAESLELRFVPVGDISRLDVSPTQTPILDALLTRRARPIVA